MVLESLDRSLGSIDSMIAGFNQLDIDLFRFDEVFNHFAAFVVQNVQFWFESSFLQIFVDFHVGFHVARCFPGFIMGRTKIALGS